MEDKIIGIITIIEEETRAVEKVLQLSEKPLVQGKRLEYEGKVGNYHVIMTQCLQQGEQSVISAFSYLMKQYKPDMICLVGIAGGINDDVNYTSVVLAEGVVGYDLSKETENGICRRGKEFSVNVETRPLYQAVARAISKKEIEPATNSIGKTINITIGDIASGSAVIKSTRSKIREWINTYNDKILACEMEAWGFTSAFYESKLNDEQPGNGICIIRGVSDMADEDKSKEEVQKYRQPAAENAAIVLRELISIMGRA